MKKSVLLALKLFVICLVATFVLAFTNSKTEPVIEEAAKKAEIEAFSKVFEGLESVEPVEDASLINKNIKGINQVMIGGQQEGYVYTVDSPSGYDGPVTFVVGVKNDGTVTGLQVLAQTETQGYGARVTEPAFAEGMKGVVLAGHITAEGAGGGPDIMPAISGATRTTNAMEQAMNMVVETHAALTGASVDTSVPITELTEQDLLQAFSGADSLSELADAPTDEVVRKVYEAKAGDTVLGHLFQVTSPAGFAGNIEFLIGLDGEDSIKGFVLVKHGESEGFGAKIAEDDYKAGLLDKKLSEAPIAITGATITSTAMEEAIQAVEKVQAAL